VLEILKIVGPFVAGVATTLGVGWGVWKHRHERRDHLRVELFMALPILDNGMPADWVAQITAINPELRDVIVTSAWIESAADGRRLFQPRALPGATLPGRVPARGSALAWFDIDEAEREGFPICDAMLVGCVSTAAGEEFRAPARVIYASESTPESAVGARGGR
jgi:hypothetical protein